MIIKILGTGCSNCKRAKEIAKQAVKDLGIEAMVQDVMDIQTIMSYGVIETPAIVIDEKVVGYGGVPSPKQMTKLLQDASSA
jgi:small redox-active disulfide protein 2